MSPLRPARSALAMPGGGTICLLEASSIVASHDDPVSSWLDGGSLGLTLTAPAPEQRPLFKTNVINGKPAVYFESDANIRQLSAAIDPTGVTDAELIAVVRSVSGTPGFNNAGGFVNVSNDSETQHYPWMDGVIYDSFGRAARTSFTPSVSLANWHTYNVRSTPTVKTSYLNGVLQHTAGSGASQFLSTFRIGWSTSTINFHGWVALVAIYTRVLSSDERAQAAEYILETYGLTL